MKRVKFRIVFHLFVLSLTFVILPVERSDAQSDLKQTSTLSDLGKALTGTGEALNATSKALKATAGATKAVYVTGEALNSLKPAFESLSELAASMKGLDSDSPKSIIMINGKKIPSDQLQVLKNIDIESLEILHGRKATILYGDEAKNGVILITTKGRRSL